MNISLTIMRCYCANFKSIWIGDFNAFTFRFLNDILNPFALCFDFRNFCMQSLHIRYVSIVCVELFFQLYWMFCYYNFLFFFS